MTPQITLRCQADSLKPASVFSGRFKLHASQALISKDPNQHARYSIPTQCKLVSPAMCTLPFTETFSGLNFMR